MSIWFFAQGMNIYRGNRGPEAPPSKQTDPCPFGWNVCSKVINMVSSGKQLLKEQLKHIVLDIRRRRKRILK